MGDEELVAEAETAVRQAVSNGAVNPQRLEFLLHNRDARLDGSIVGVAVLRLLRRGQIALDDQYSFVPAGAASVGD